MPLAGRSKACEMLAARSLGSLGGVWLSPALQAVMSVALTIHVKKLAQTFRITISPLQETRIGLGFVSENARWQNER
jgi:hypothetical protein